MVDPETSSTPISTGDASDGSQCFSTPSKLRLSDNPIQRDGTVDVDNGADLCPSNTFPSTPSSSPYSDTRDRNFAISQDCPCRVAAERSVNQSVAASVAGAMFGLKVDGDEAEVENLPRLLFGCIFSYLVLGIYIYTIALMLVIISHRSCVEVYGNLMEGSSGKSTETGQYERACIDLFTGKLACAHSITFGLISAVVIHETGSSDSSAQDRLSTATKLIWGRRKAKRNIFQRALCSTIVALPAVYVVTWALSGLMCFLYSVTTPNGSAGPLFYTGQTWLGIIIRASYSFFGVQPKRTCPACNSNEIGHSHYHHAQQDDVDEELGLLPSSTRPHN